MADKIEGSNSSDSENTSENSPQNETSASTETTKSNANTFVNDGSFLELFKKKIEEEIRGKQTPEQSPASSSTVKERVSFTLDNTKRSRLKESDDTETSSNSRTEDVPKSEQKIQQEGEPAKKKYSLLSHVGKRPGGKLTLKTGQVKKSKPSEQESAPQDAWSKYMSEVEKYKAHECSDDDKVRPLVK